MEGSGQASYGNWEVQAFLVTVIILAISNIYIYFYFSNCFFHIKFKYYLFHSFFLILFSNISFIMKVDKEKNKKRLKSG